MSDLLGAKEELKRYSIARIPFIAVNTIERARTLKLLKEVSEELTLTFYVHTLSKEHLRCDRLFRRTDEA